MYLLFGIGINIRNEKKIYMGFNYDVFSEESTENAYKYVHGTGYTIHARAVLCKIEFMIVFLPFFSFSVLDTNDVACIGDAFENGGSMQREQLEINKNYGAQHTRYKFSIF